MRGSGEGGAGRGELARGSGVHRGGAVRESGSVLRVCFVYSPFFSVSLLLLFPLFAVLLNCPYPNPPVSACFSFHSPPHPSGGRGGRVALLLLAVAETRTISLF